MPNILVSNDDGITAKGIAALVEVAKEFGTVTVVAPDSPQSAQSNSITLYQPLRLKSSNVFTGIEAYACDGTPTDCVKLAKNIIFKENKIEIITIEQTILNKKNTMSAKGILLNYLRIGKILYIPINKSTDEKKKVELRNIFKNSDVKFIICNGLLNHLLT